MSECIGLYKSNLALGNIMILAKECLNEEGMFYQDMVKM